MVWNCGYLGFCAGHVGEQSHRSEGWSPPGSEERETDLVSYGSVLRYRCGPARSFLAAESDSLYEERNLTCHWNQSWSPQPSLDRCVWTACLHPPQPDLNTSLVMLWSGQPVEFYENVSYVCSSEELYFEWDREMAEFNVTCRPGGTWDQPALWPSCLQCKNIRKFV